MLWMPPTSVGDTPPHRLGDSDELVADAALADDTSGGRGVTLHLLAQAADVDLQVVDLVGVFASPDLGQEGVVRQHSARVAGKVVEKGGLGRREAHWLGADGHSSAGVVDAQVA